MNKIVVYTAIFGGKDRLGDIKKEFNIDYVCFTDDKSLKSETWEIRQIESDPKKSFRMQAKIYKILPHLYFPDHKYSIWIDGNILPISDIRLLIKYLKDANIAMFKHEDRSCIYNEAEVCSRVGKDSPETIEKQMNRYLAENYPKENGLTWNGIIFRKHNDLELIKAMEAWWNELHTGSSRDQLSFIYLAWKMNLKYNLLPGTRAENLFFRTNSHLKRK